MEILAAIPTGLLILACPISMGVMMFFMMRGMGGDKASPPQSSREIDSLRAEQARLAAEVDRLEQERSSDLEPANRE